LPCYRSSLSSSAFITPIKNLKPARTLTGGDNLGVALAALDLPNVAAGIVDLLRDQGRTPRTSASFAGRNVAASVNADGCRLGIEVGLEHPAPGRFKSHDP
jgi:hypothetical protein